jgi:hypothetical protein
MDNILPVAMIVAYTIGEIGFIQWIDTHPRALAKLLKSP